MTGTAADALGMIYAMPLASPGIVQTVAGAGASAVRVSHPGLLPFASADPLVGGLVALALTATALASFVVAARCAHCEHAVRRTVAGAWFTR